MSGQPDSVRPGEVLAGKYQVERVLGRGGMGIVVRAVDLARGLPCAVKLLVPEALRHPTAVERFLREARATAQLTTPHVVKLSDVGTLPSGAPYMAMELLDGADLGELLKRRGALPAHEAARYVIEACNALAEAHAAGIVHRDLKPQNLFLARRADGTVGIKVLDFGLAKALVTSPASGPSDPELTVTNAVLGSPSYMSPEQIRSARNVDPRSDVWSLGVVLYQLVTGQLPFQSPTAGQLVVKIVRADPPPPSKQRPGLPLALDGVILRCLEKDPVRRFGDMNELAAALAPFVPSSSPPSSTAAPGVPARRRNVGLIALAVAATIVMVIAVAIAILH